MYLCNYNTLIISKTLWLLKIQFKYFSRTFQNKNISSENVNYYYYIWFFFLILLCHFKNNMFKLSDRICNTLKEAFMTRICCWLCCFFYFTILFTFKNVALWHLYLPTLFTSVAKMIIFHFIAAFNKLYHVRKSLIHDFFVVL